MTGLTPKQQQFVEEYLIDLNATQAAIRAGYSPKTAKSIGQENLTKPDVAAAVEAALAARSRRTQVTADMVLLELGRIGFSNMGHYARWDGNAVDLKCSDGMTEDALRCVAEVSQTVTEHGGTVRFKLHDKPKALELLGRHLGLFTDRLVVDVTAHLPEQDKALLRDYAAKPD